MKNSTTPLRSDTDLFPLDIHKIKTYEEYELNNNMTGDLDEPWSDNGVPYQLCDHICEPFLFNNGKTKWPTCSSDIDGFCNGGELPGMVRVRFSAASSKVKNASTQLLLLVYISTVGEYDLWLMRIEQYFFMKDYSLWEVILNGNIVLKRTVRETEQEYESTTAEEKQDRRNEMKARGTLLMALPNKDQLNDGNVHTQIPYSGQLMLWSGAFPAQQGTVSPREPNPVGNPCAFPSVRLPELSPFSVTVTDQCRDSYQAEEEHPKNFALMAFTSSGSSSSSDSKIASTALLLQLKSFVNSYKDVENQEYNKSQIDKDETVYKEWKDRMERAATTASRLYDNGKWQHNDKRKF
ncbi:hypothetical protein Tco_0218518 [Tanacetum coccineum]